MPLFTFFALRMLLHRCTDTPT